MVVGRRVRVYCGIVGRVGEGYCGIDFVVVFGGVL